MANPGNLKPRWQPGESGNPSGRPPNRLTVEKLRDIIDQLSFMTRGELQAVIQDPATTMIVLQIASVIAQAAKSGDYSRVSAILDRAIGKVADVRYNANLDVFDGPLKKTPRFQLHAFVKDDVE